MLVGEVNQFRVREELQTGIFDYNTSNDLINYALKLSTLTNHLDPPMREGETVI